MNSHYLFAFGGLCLFHNIWGGGSAELGMEFGLGEWGISSHVTNDLLIQEKEHKVCAECKAIRAEVTTDSESLVPSFQGSFQRINKRMDEDQTIFTEART